MLTDLGLQTRDQIDSYERIMKSISHDILLGRSTGCISTRICTNCNHAIRDSRCLCIPKFICPNCHFENGKDLYNDQGDEARPIKTPNPFMYSSIEDYEQAAGFKVNEAFKMGWDMARLTKSPLN